MREWDGVYTVEAAAIVSLTLLIIMSAILFGFDVYRDTINEVSAYEQLDIDAADTFRVTSAIRSLTKKDEGETENNSNAAKK